MVCCSCDGEGIEHGAVKWKRGHSDYKENLEKKRLSRHRCV